MREIGSEFPYCDSMKGIGMKKLNIADEAYVFSGRTAIETIIKNIPHMKKILLPSYCCDSMIEPFRRADIKVNFYDVNYKEKLVVQLENYEEVDAILWCNYFGFAVNKPDFSIFIAKGGIVIEDITHSFLSDKAFDKCSKYLVASIRKWGPVLSGGYCASTKEVLKNKPNRNPSQEFLILKKEGMLLKKEFLKRNQQIDKKGFLDKFAISNKWLAENYFNLTMDEESKNIFLCHDWELNRQIRRENAKVLYAGLKNHKGIDFLFKEEEMDCPLFVPIIIKNNRRDEIRKKLIENKIYCPVHWPKPNDRCESNLYDLELSLICDYRYDVSDMQRIVSVLCECE